MARLALLRTLLGVALLGAAVGAVTIGPAAAGAADSSRARSCGWLLEPSTDGENVLFPDTGTRYLAAVLPAPPGGWIEITGQFPHARYMSLQTYSLTLQPATGLHDDQIQPDPGSVNPFRPGADRDATNRSYTVRIVAGRPPASGAAPNTLYTDSSQGGREGIAFAYRIYLPDRGAGTFGGVPAPKITLVLAGGRVRIPLPTCPDLVPDLHLTQTLAGLGLANYGLPPLGLLAPKQPRWHKYVNLVASYGTALTDTQFTAGALSPLITKLAARLPAGLGENVDVKYIYAYLSQEWGKVVMFRAKLPSTPRTEGGETSWPAQQQLRYWSMCTASLTTQTYGCVNDEDVAVDAHGYVTVVISTAADRPADATAACGVSWLPWGAVPKGLVYMRNMLPAPGFTHAIQDARPGTEKQTLGDYYPVGTYFASPQAFDTQEGCHAPMSR